MTFPEVSNCNTATNNIIIPMSFNDARLDLKNHEQVFITNTRQKYVHNKYGFGENVT